MGLTKLKYGLAELPVPLGLVYEMTDYIMAQADTDEERTGAGHVGQCCEAAADQHSYEELVARYCKRVPVTMPNERYLPDEFFLHGTSYVGLPPSEAESLTAVATAIRELSAEDRGVVAPLVETLGVNGYKPTEEELDEASASADIAKWEWRMQQNITDMLPDALYALAHDTPDNDSMTGLCYCIDQAHNYDFLRTLHSSGLALKFEQALAQTAANDVAAE